MKTWFTTFPQSAPMAGIQMGAMAGHHLAGRKRLTGQLIKQMEHSCNPSEPETIYHDHLGRPYLDFDNIAVSYSYCNGLIYAGVALSSTLGLDAASAVDFSGCYPYHKVFTKTELMHCESITRDRSEGAALLWACKEAVVKAMGTGFRGVEPIDLKMTALTPAPGYYLATMDGAVSASVQIIRVENHWVAATTHTTYSGHHGE